MNERIPHDGTGSAATNEHDEFFTHDDVARIAKQFWEEEGRPEGKADEHWQRALQHLQKGPQTTRVHRNTEY